MQLEGCYRRHSIQEIFNITGRVNEWAFAGNGLKELDGEEDFRPLLKADHPDWLITFLFRSCKRNPQQKVCALKVFESLSRSSIVQEGLLSRELSFLLLLPRSPLGVIDDYQIPKRRTRNFGRPKNKKVCFHTFPPPLSTWPDTT